jgi:hypothetical protein
MGFAQSYSQGNEKYFYDVQRRNAALNIIKT